MGYHKRDLEICCTWPTTPWSLVTQEAEVVEVMLYFYCVRSVPLITKDYKFCPTHVEGRKIECDKTLTPSEMIYILLIMF